MKIIHVNLYNSQNNFSHKKIKFKSNQTPEGIHRTIKNLKIERENIIKEISLREKQCKNDFAFLRLANLRLEQISKSFEKLLEILDFKKNNYTTEDALIINKFLIKMSQIDKNKGFNRIFGYEDIKILLTNNFIFDSIMKNKTSNENTVPNAILFYGPNGNGKSTFAKALAEQSMTNLSLINTACFENEALESIKEELEKALKNYINSGKDKQRTIILVDEADLLGEKESLVHDEFVNLIKDCSDKYKSTIFMTTNYPEFLSEKILSEEITPLKVGIRPADIDIAKKIILNLLGENYSEDKNLDKVLDLLFFNKEIIYSNGNIAQLTKQALRENLIQPLDIMVKYLQTNQITPKITQDTIRKFNNFREKYNTF